MSNKDAVRRFYEEVVNQGKIELIDELVSPDVVEHEEFPGLGGDRESVKQFFKMFRNAFPDVRFTVEDLIEEGDKVVSRATMRGTHKGEFMDIAATGKSVEVALIDILRIDSDGKVAEHWGLTDTAAMMQQLGVMPG